MSRSAYSKCCMLMLAAVWACGEGNADTSAEREPGLEAESADYTADPVVDDTSAAPIQGALLPAGESSQRLAIAHWVISDTQLEGYSNDGALLAQFVLDAGAGVLESVLPEAGFKMLDGSENALTDRSRAYLDALSSDLARVANAASDARDDGPATQPGAELGTAEMALLVACFTDVLACQATGVLGLIDGRWTNFTCENRAIFGCRAPFPIALVI